MTWTSRTGIGLHVFCLCVISIGLSSVAAQQPISFIKGLPPGTVVTTTGTISSGNEFGQVRYMQDATAGIALYSTSLSDTKPGDSVIVTGTLSSYKGEVQISPVTSFSTIIRNRMLEETVSDNFPALQDSGYLARLVSFHCLGLNTCEPVFGDGPYLAYDQAGHSSKMVIRTESPLIGQSIPGSALNISGIWTRIEDQYQLLVQNLSDASEGNCHLLTPAVIKFNGDELSLRWNSVPVATSWIEWGIHAFTFSTDLGNTGPYIEESFPGLAPGELFEFRLGQVDDQLDTFYAMPVFAAAPSVGQPIEVYFDRDVDTAFSDGSHPEGTGSSVIELAVINRIDQVQHTLEVAMYNNGRPSIIQAIVRAVNRGVKVRYIADDETSNTALQGIFSFPILYRGGDGIMHNKFMIGDAEYPGLAWVWTGSTNFTSGQLTSDPNNAFAIDDQALALNYRKEFDEMWGADPNHVGSQTGEGKIDDTAHRFQYNGTLLESYFSPSDEVDCHIDEVLESADYQVEIGLLLLTSENLIDEIIALHHRGVDVRIILEDEASSQNAVQQLAADGIPMAFHDASPIFHHKYAIIDEGYPDSDPTVISGSHNWTYSADHINDENTIILHSQSIANIFRQEFEARWKELYTALDEPKTLHASLRIYPMPANDFIQVENPIDQSCTIKLMDNNGTILQQFQLARLETGRYLLDPGWPSGSYWIRSIWADQVSVAPLMIIRN